ncbi:MAG TPA: hypothetical protein VGZ73_04300 [Bryobacteraceae bacterium]|jgi:hypothetical protein|nr:hypothetical protein [Bryobacteraceae bacterium]
MKRSETIIEIDELVLMGDPGSAAIEAALLRALREHGVGHALGQRDVSASLARDVSRSVGHAVDGGKF